MQTIIIPKKQEFPNLRKHTHTHTPKPTNLHNPDPDLHDPQNERLATKRQQTKALQHQGPKQEHISKPPTF